MRIKLEDLVRELVELHGDNLYSIVLYGSAVTDSSGNRESRPLTEPEDAIEQTNAGQRVLVVLKEIAPSDLKRVRGAIGKWHAAGNPIPAYFTLEEINDSTDVFPIEFLDMSQKRKVLAGQDPFSKLEIPTYNLRHQVEYELRSKLIRLRALYLPASSKPGRLARLMFDSLQSFEVVFRHVVTLLGGDAPDDRRQAVSSLCGLLGLDHSIFTQVHRFGIEDAPMLEVETEHIFAAYLGQISRIIEAVDSLADSPAASRQ